MYGEGEEEEGGQVTSMVVFLWLFFLLAGVRMWLVVGDCFWMYYMNELLLSTIFFWTFSHFKR